MDLKPKITFTLILAVVAILSLLSFLPLSAPFRQANLYSKLYSDSVLCSIAGFELSVTEEVDDFLPELEEIEYAQQQLPVVEPNRVEKVDSLPNTEQPQPSVAPVDSAAQYIEKESSEVRKQVARPANITPIEDFSKSSIEINKFYDNLKNASSLSRPVRIAVLGDSFIEGDIFTQDLREMMQHRFSGRGVGFVPITSAVASFRQSVSHTFSGWSTHSIATKMSHTGYIISSYTYSPKNESAVVSYRASNSRRYLNHFSRARFLFQNKGEAKINVLINGTTSQTFTPISSEHLSQVVVVGDSISTVSFTVEDGENFTAYGVYLDDVRGVSVDNYSVRGNSGVSLSSIDAKLTSQLGEILPIDLVIFEYGLNVAQADVKSYGQYLSQMQRAVNHLRQCLPNAAILIMSIPDRTRRSSQGWVTMPGVEAMARTQRDLARETGVLYWSTLEAMRARGGMGKFVERGWAAKDHTHLSSKGGREVGRALFEALMFDMENR